MKVWLVLHEGMYPEDGYEVDVCATREIAERVAKATVMNHARVQEAEVLSAAP